MQILSKKRYQFKNGPETFITQGGMAIETAPDWIAKDDLYNMAVANGNIVEIASKGRAVTEQSTAGDVALEAAAKPRRTSAKK